MARGTGDYAPVIGGDAPDDDVIYAQLFTDANGDAVLYGVDGAPIPFGAKTTTLYATTQAIATSGAATPIDFSASMIDENWTGNLTDNTISIPAGATHVQLIAACRFNNLAGSAGVYRRLWVEMDGGSVAWTKVSSAFSESLYVAANLADPALSICTGKIPLTFLSTVLGATVARFRLVAQHDNGASLSMSAMGDAPGADPCVYLTANFS